MIKINLPAKLIDMASKPKNVESILKKVKILNCPYFIMIDKISDWFSFV